MKRDTGLLLAGVFASATGAAADRAIVVPPAQQMSWGFPTHTTTARLRPQPGAGLWQRESGAARAVGANCVSEIEYQLPEAAARKPTIVPADQAHVQPALAGVQLGDRSDG